MWALIAVALAGLVVGALLGGRTDVLERIGVTEEDPETPAAPVSVGAIETTADQDSGEPGFGLPVFNASDDEVDVTVTAVPGLTSRLKSETVSELRPGTWDVVHFSATPNCDRQSPRELSSVRLEVKAADGTTEAAVALPDRAAVLLEYELAFCGTSSRPLPEGFIEGVWMVERVFGSSTSLERVHLMRFSDDGTFVADPEGGLFSGDQGVWGSYRINDELLTTDVKGGYGCPPASGTVWRVNLLPDDRLSMTVVRGDCPDGTNEVWIARRVLRDVGLPSRPPGVPPAGSVDLKRADDVSVCRAKAKAVTRLPTGFPREFPLPSSTTVIDVRDGGADGVIVVGLTGAEYQRSVDALIGQAQQSGWNVTSSAATDRHAEASWTGHGYQGRWALRVSDRCRGEVVVEVLARKQ